MKNLEPIGRENADKVYPGAKYPLPYGEDHRKPLYLIACIPMNLTAVRQNRWEVMESAVSCDFNHTARTWDNYPGDVGKNYVAALLCVDEVRYSAHAGDWLFTVKVLDVDVHDVFGRADGDVSYDVDGLGSLYATVDRWMRTTQAGRLAEMEPEFHRPKFLPKTTEPDPVLTLEDDGGTSPDAA